MITALVLLALGVPRAAIAQDFVANQDSSVQTDAAWLTRAPQLTGRVRLVGGDPLALATAVGGNPDVAIYSAPVTTEGRVELLPFLREQSVSITAHRFGNPDRAMAGLTV